MAAWGATWGRRESVVASLGRNGERHCRKTEKNGRNREYRSFFELFYGTTLFLWAET